MISTDLNTDVGSIKAKLLARGDGYGTYQDLESEEAYDRISGCTMMETEAQVSALLHNIVTKINDAYCPNKTVDTDVTYTDADGNQVWVNFLSFSEEKPVRMIGDYDIDGVNAAYILKEGLEGLGADVDTDIPDRIKDGYGLKKMLIDRALDDGIDTIITCDNGIAAAEEITYGRKNGLTVIVTDHHQVPFVEINKEREYLLPQADAVVDPRRPDCEYPFKNLCGAAVAYKLVEALYNVMLRDPEDVDYLMENVAIATVGDVMALKGENRIFVKQGLEMLSAQKMKG